MQVDLGHPDAATLVEGAAALVERSGHTLAGWQVARRSDALKSVRGASSQSWAMSPNGSGAMLATVVRTAAT
ncbi:hypothetical protein H4N58_07340 [Mumia sp. ZJ1417]|uniref:hypothetical protein n=1 Tax=Mumia sp. ZJ1417 TaxID=2708082 RepID=UPI00142475DE|nr:hypothetical protein [Mumia sp. ZJ1417]QMW67680.1 hypothetical protein H4N58_07340 [Mumia sp. ZJ1417]